MKREPLVFVGTCDLAGQLRRGKPLAADQPVAAAGNALKISDLRHQLKENESQRVEITGYANQLGIQLHRWQLRLQTLKERQEKLQTELAEISKPPSWPG